MKTNCTCTDSTGSTTVKCCNICGLPIKGEVWGIKQQLTNQRKKIEELRKYYQDIRWANDDWFDADEIILKLTVILEEK